MVIDVWFIVLVFRLNFMILFCIVGDLKLILLICLVIK